jgi:hypothetical protein
MGGRPWTEAEKAEFRKLRSAGRTAAEIARRLRRPLYGVKSASRTLGITSPRQKHFTRPDQVETLRRMNAEGRTDREIAKILGINSFVAIHL